MRQNDPNNLRIPALRIISELLPLGSRAGVWLFAERPEVLIPPSTVDAQWRAAARTRLGRIHARGQFTDIEAALETALNAWLDPGEQDARHIVLLTDGMVDVAPRAGIDVNAESRRRILDLQIPRLRSLGVKVHVIALSEMVDLELARALTQRTGGWLEIAPDAEALQRVFLRMLEQVAAPTTVPLEDSGHFVIDPGVVELTLLAFRRPEQKIELTTPSGMRLTAAQPGRDVRWSAEPAYDLVTIAKPEPGIWRLQGSLDPDNRVVVLTDLDLASAPVANSVPDAIAVPLTVWLTERQRPVTELSVLELTTAQAIFTAATDERKRYVLPLSLERATGRYRAVLEPGTLPPGAYRLELLIESGTFKRQLRKYLKIEDAPIAVAYDIRRTAESTTAGVVLRVTLTIDTTLLDPATLFGTVRLREVGGRALGWVDVEGLNAATVSYELPIERPGRYRASVRLRGTTQAGEALVFAKESENLEIAVPAVAQETAPAVTAERRPAWVRAAVYFVGAHLLFALLAAVIFWLTRPPPGLPAITPEPRP